MPTVTGVLWSLLTAAVVTASLLLAFKLIAFLLFGLNEALLLWNTAFAKRKSKQLHTYYCETQYLDEVGVTELYYFLSKEMVDVALTDEEERIRAFHQVLLSYKYIMISRERTDGSLRGFMTIDLQRNEHQGQKYTFVRIGLAFFRKHYRGSVALLLIPFFLFLKELILHPTVPIYVGGKSFSYKSYIIAMKFKNYYPRYDKETPPFYKLLIDRFALSIKSPFETYNAEKNVLERELTNIKEQVLVISEEDLRDPHIKFFVEQNPGWKKGHQLVCVGRIAWTDAFHLIRLVYSRMFKRHKGAGGLRRSRLTKRTTFQDIGANRYLRECLEADAGGGLVELPCQQNTGFHYITDELATPTTYMQ